MTLLCDFHIYLLCVQETFAGCYKIQDKQKDVHTSIHTHVLAYFRVPYCQKLTKLLHVLKVAKIIKTFVILIYTVSQKNCHCIVVHVHLPP